MSFHPRLRSVRVLFAGLSLMLTVILLSAVTLAQDVETPKYDIFVGYQWLHPGGTVPAPFGNFNSPGKLQLKDMPDGFGTAFTYNFQKYFGLEGDFGYNWDNYESTLSLGPKLTYRTDDSNYFLHTLLSYNRLNVDGLPTGNGIGAILGGGWDLKLTHMLYLRIFEADYVWGRQNYASVVSSSFPDLRRVSLEGIRLRTGLVFNFGYPQLATPTASCSLQPSEVMVGEPITATATTTNFNPKHTLNYAWSGTGGKVAGKDNTASIDTNGVAGGSYTVTATITDPKKKTGGEATCSANYTVKEPPKNPPTMSCSASPSDLQAGGSSTITCTCTSPDNVPVTVAGWTASGGSVSGSGNTATLNTAGASAGPVTVSATCTDSRGLNSQASTQVTVQNPPPHHRRKPPNWPTATSRTWPRSRSRGAWTTSARANWTTLPRTCSRMQTTNWSSSAMPNPPRSVRTWRLNAPSIRRPISPAAKPSWELIPTASNAAPAAPAPRPLNTGSFPQAERSREKARNPWMNP